MSATTDKWRCLTFVRGTMRTYYFDKKDGSPVRDNEGITLPDNSAAIHHSKQLAKELRIESPAGDRDLYIAVLDESGREIHREAVYRQERTE